MRFQAQRGTNDVLPSDSYKWAWIESQFRELTRLYGYREIRTPTFEDTALFVRTSGETSDIVSKQMYSFVDKGERNVTLKPEGTAPAIRAVVEHGLCPPGTIVRLAYITPIFRYERPQKGRFREAHQFGLELLGSPSAEADAEVIETTVLFYRWIGIADAEVSLNSLGREDCRKRYRAALLEHAKSFLSSQPQEVRDKIDKNPLRLLDSKDPDAIDAMKSAPPVTAYLEDESKAHFDELQRLLTNAGIGYRLAPEIVRGLDYYTQTVFEVESSQLGAQNALCGGGRYDLLVEELGGSPTPSVGVGMGIERALMVLEGMGVGPNAERPAVFLTQATNAARDTILKLARELRAANVSAIVDPDARSLRAQLRQADKLGARFSIVVGDEELDKGIAQVRDLMTGAQSEIPLGEVVESIGSSL